MRPPLGLDFFHALEDDLARMSRYIEFHPDNFKTYSLELVRLLLAAGSEIDVALKQLCKLAQPNAKKTENIDEHKAIVLPRYNDLLKQGVRIPYYDLTVFPWKGWDTENPQWWKAYNKVKHDRVVHYPQGNLENAINAVAALGMVMQYVAGPNMLGGDPHINFRGTLGGMFAGLNLRLHK